MTNRWMKNRRQKIGKAPGTPIHIGKKTMDAVCLQFMRYNEAEYAEHAVAKPDSVVSDDAHVCWLQVSGVHDADMIGRIGEKFHIHNLAIEDIVNTDQRAKWDEFEDFLWIVLPALSFQAEKGFVEIEQIGFVIKKNLLISFQEKKSDIFDHVKHRLRESSGKIRKRGSDYLAYTLMDVVVDHYFAMVEHLGDVVEQAESDVLLRPSAAALDRIYHLRREVLLAKRHIWPIREVMRKIEQSDSGLLDQSLDFYFRDLRDHVVHVMETLDMLHDMLGNMLDIYLSSMSHKMNESIRMLSVVGTTFLPLSLIAGLYGMNFAWMPLLHWRWGYAVVLASMLSLVAVSLFYFKRKKWF